MGGCLFDEVKPRMRIYREEVFGPVLTVHRYDGWDSGLAMADATPDPAGMRRSEAAIKFRARRLEAGRVAGGPSLAYLAYLIGGRHGRGPAFSRSRWYSA